MAKALTNESERPVEDPRAGSGVRKAVKLGIESERADREGD